jgi:hypothetical protein
VRNTMNFFLQLRPEWLIVFGVLVGGYRGLTIEIVKDSQEASHFYLVEPAEAAESKHAATRFGVAYRC